MRLSVVLLPMVDQFADGLLMGFTQFFSGVMTILGTLGFMLSINVKITLVVVLITPVSFFVPVLLQREHIKCSSFSQRLVESRQLSLMK